MKKTMVSLIHNEGKLMDIVNINVNVNLDDEN